MLVRIERKIEGNPMKRKQTQGRPGANAQKAQSKGVPKDTKGGRRRDRIGRENKVQLINHIGEVFRKKVFD